MFPVITVYGIRSLCSWVTAGSQPSPEVPPTQGTSMLTVWTTPSGVVSENVPPENAQIESLFVALERVA